MDCIRQVILLVVCSFLLLEVPALPLNDDSYYYNENDYGDASDPDLDVEDYSADEIGGENLEYMCPDREYSVPLDLLCDGFPDCSDGTDEDEDTCRIYKLASSTASTTIIEERTVEKIDEFDINYYSDYDGCSEAEFQCSSLSALCIPQSSVCDGQSDCPDGEDEANCDIKKHYSTTAAIETTTNNPTFDLVTSAENKVSSDNATAVTSTVTSTLGSETAAGLNWDDDLSACEVEEYQCRTSPGDCVPRALLCDGFDDCTDGSDEIGCDCEVNEYRCVSGLCINATYRCDGYDNCGDFSDEIIGCPFLPDFTEDQSNLQGQINSTEAVPADKNASFPPLSQSELSEESSNIYSICPINRCENDGDCFMKENGDLVCVCKENFTGTHCESKKKCLSETSCNNSGSSGHILKTNASILVFIIISMMSLMGNLILL